MWFGCGSPEGTAARRLPGDLLSDGPWRGARGATFPGPLSLSADQTQEKQAFRGLVACPASGTNSLVRPVAVGPLRRAAPLSNSPRPPLPARGGAGPDRRT